MFSLGSNHVGWDGLGMAFMRKLIRYAKVWWVNIKEKPTLRPKPLWMYIKHLPGIKWEGVDIIFLA
jgi:hypothetical protein